MFSMFSSSLITSIHVSNIIPECSSFPIIIVACMVFTRVHTSYAFIIIFRFTCAGLCSHVYHRMYVRFCCSAAFNSRSRVITNYIPHFNCCFSASTIVSPWSTMASTNHGPSPMATVSVVESSQLWQQLARPRFTKSICTR